VGRYYVGSVGASGVVTGVGLGIGLLSRANTNFDASSAVDTSVRVRIRLPLATRSYTVDNYERTFDCYPLNTFWLDKSNRLFLRLVKTTA